MDIKKMYRRGGSSLGSGSAGTHNNTSVESLTRQVNLLKLKLERRTIKISKVAESYISYYEQYSEYDYFLTPPDLPNPWHTTDNTEFWEAEKLT